LSIDTTAIELPCPRFGPFSLRLHTVALRLDVSTVPGQTIENCKDCHWTGWGTCNKLCDTCNHRVKFKGQHAIGVLPVRRLSDEDVITGGIGPCMMTSDNTMQFISGQSRAFEGGAGKSRVRSGRERADSHM
jgi:hypothetical protein